MTNIHSLVRRDRTFRSGMAASVMVLMAMLATWTASTSASAAPCGAYWQYGIGSPGTNAPILAVASLPSGEIVATGNFPVIGGVPCSRIGRWNGYAWAPMGEGFNGNVYALLVLGNGDLIAAGDFTFSGSTPMPCIARWNGTAWSAFGYVPGGFNLSGTVYALTEFQGRLLLGGNLSVSTTGGVARGVVAWDPEQNGGAGAWTKMTGDIVGDVFALATNADGAIIAGGSFLNVGGDSSADYLVYTYGGFWSPMRDGSGNGVNGPVYALKASAGGEDVFVGGSFTAAGFAAAKGVVRLNANGFTAMGNGANGTVKAITLTAAGDVVVGGMFTAPPGSPSSGANIAIWKANTWSTLGGASHRVDALATHSSGDIVLGGIFTAVAGPGGGTVGRIAMVAPPNTAPDVVANPVPVAAAPGSNIYFAVTMSGLTPYHEYHWRRNGVEINRFLNPSAATATLQLPSVQAGDVASYDCLVRNLGSCGTITTAAALTIVATPTFAGCQPADIAYDDGSPLPPFGQPGGNNNGVNEGDYNLFFQRFFNGCD